MNRIPAEAVAEATRVLRAGGVVCFPTETFYGLGVDACNAIAVAGLVTQKGRDEGRPIAVIVADWETAASLWKAVPDLLRKLADRHWPGPLTIVAPARAGLPTPLVGSRVSIGVRVSSHPWAHALASAFGGPITATSANRTGEPPVTTASEVKAIFGDEIDFYLDGGPAPGGEPSTVVELEADGSLRMLRPGAIHLDLPGPR